eukprot:gene5851-6444_t
MLSEVLTHDVLLPFTILAQAVFAFCYLISSLFVGSNVYAGFNGILLGLVFLAVIGLSYYGLYKEVTRTLYGVVLGAVVMLCFISLQSAIFWAQYGSCKFVPINPKNGQIGVECDHQAAMRSMCAFSVFMFLSYLVQVATLIHFKNDILGAAPANESVGNRDGIPSFIISKPSNASTLPPSLPTPPSDSGSLSFDHSYKAPILPNQIPQQASLPPTLTFEHNSDYPNTADL